MHDAGFHPYRPHLHQRLILRDYERKTAFGNWALSEIKGKEDFLGNVIWADEARFGRDANVNS